ncbi:unnamed protein product [Symbiodinium sp. CCMP2456]|nr:unnamed protein product [Symbiodinium sp. CCMP2456]
MLCEAPNGPIELNHPCLQTPKPAVLVALANQAMHVSAAPTGDASGVWVALAVVGWALVLGLILVLRHRAQQWDTQMNQHLMEKFAYKRHSAAQLRRTWRLAARAGVYQEAFDTTVAEKQAADVEHLEKWEAITSALESGETYLADAAELQESELGVRLLDACTQTMYARMEMSEAAEG